MTATSDLRLPARTDDGLATDRGPRAEGPPARPAGLDAGSPARTASPGGGAAGPASGEGEERYDIVGVGFGPSNMALAAACSEDPGAQHAVFFDAAEGPSWHEGMLLPDAGLQVSFAKDLVTFRNPTSSLSFLNFLVERGRIHDFFNRGSSAPLRVEFFAYLRWAAERLAEYVRYRHRVTAVQPQRSGETITGYRVTVEGPEGVSTVLARHVVVAAGLQPNVPEGLPEDERVLHTSRYLHRVEGLGEVRSAVVLGGGQSAAEVALDLRSRFPDARVHLVHSRFGIVPADSTPFANRIFDNTSIDRLYEAPEEVRERLGRIHANTNNSVVHESTIQALYDAWYADSWAGRERIVFHDASRIAGVEPSEDGLDVAVRNDLDGDVEHLRSDVLALGTGYRPLDLRALLGEDADLLARDAEGRVVAERDYSVRWQAPAEGRLVAVGITQHQHGVSATLLSNIALRAGEILASLTGERAGAAR
ncbi:lysine N(6)-hydroxylase/L-ornithine N(5)-oxygenase family protein [Rothia halotolerans]|uniref:lysine N(6)-hydroxylase/L-ornithine N(5)-oxygenase family protein n=1 Tax=Rothia halotolerans TaxID=405770 RepID=UPI00101BB61A|nr:SidA/IucD/PvdA family monooxygenase [Rothia halotolerans]